MDFTSAERAALAAAASTTLHRDAAEALNVAHAFIGLVRRLRPAITLVANPYTFEGRLLSLVSRHAGVPTVALEHGSIFPGSPHWQNCPSDLVCAWGDVSRRALLACGVADERIAVTGGPRYDEVFRRAQASTERLDPAQATVLVATSGPGDQVSPAQHRDFIAALFAAAAQTPDVRWVVKLHRKDAIANYELPQAGRRSNVSIIPAEYGRDGLEIFDYLRSARALVTITSSAAFDALAVGVPVISFDVWPAAYKRTDVEFLEHGCATTVRTAEELADEVARAWRLERDPAVETAAARYVDEHFAHRGRAAQAVVRRIKELLDAAPQTSHAERR
jgi:UDP-N-acetylglucosamine 2-epimerase